jgi:hypothetical protein
VDLTFGAEGLQPGDKHLADFFLGEEFTDFGGDFGEGNFGGSGLF